jgi:hypothetical protein
MKRIVHPAISYTVIIIGAVFLAAAIFVMTKISAPNIAMYQNLTAAPLHKPAVIQDTHADFSEQAKNFIDVFNKSNLNYQIKGTNDHFVFNAVASNTGDQIAYTELSNCAGETHLYYDWKNLPKCDWGYSLKIFNIKTQSTTTLQSGSGDSAKLAGVALVFYPIAWTKNDKALIVSWSNIGLGGSGGAPPDYMSIDPKTGKMSGLGGAEGWYTGTIFFDDYSRAIVVLSSDKNPACDEEGGNQGKIVLINTETGKSQSLVEEKNRHYAVSSFNRLTNTLTYSYQTYTSTSEYSCHDTSEQETEAQIKVSAN